MRFDKRYVIHICNQSNLCETFKDDHEININILLKPGKNFDIYSDNNKYDVCLMIR